MKLNQKDLEKLNWVDHVRTSSVNNNPTAGPGSQTRLINKLFIVFLILLILVSYLLYTLKLVFTSRACNGDPVFTRVNLVTITNDTLSGNPDPTRTHIQTNEEPRKQTEIKDIVFGIAASSKLWNKRKDYIKLWYNPETIRAIAWLDKPVKTRPEENLPPVIISGDASQFPYNNKQGHRSAIRISRIVSEMVRLGLENVRWFVMGDDDTVFVTENLVRVLRKYDHNGYWYIGSSSESHLQNIVFSYGMAYGGGGFAISYPLAKAIAKMQDRCLQRYPGLYGSDDRMQACMAELGVPLTKEVGFHQFDVYGNPFGLLAAHPVAPLVSLHHLDVVEPIFPNVTRVQALRHLMVPTELDSSAILQQSICYDKSKKWTVSVSWGYAVQIFRGIFTPREIEMPARTFLNWYKNADYKGYSFNTRPVSRNPCQKPFVFFMSNARYVSSLNTTVTEYSSHRVQHPECKWKMADPAYVDEVIVHKKPDPQLWERSPRRNCCRVMNSKKKGTIMIDVGLCREAEVTEI